MSQHNSSKSFVPSGLSRGRLILRQLMTLQEKLYFLKQQQQQQQQQRKEKDESTLSTGGNGGDLSDSDTCTSLGSVTHRLEVIEAKVDTLTSLLVNCLSGCRESSDAAPGEAAAAASSSLSSSTSTSTSTPSEFASEKSAINECIKDGKKSKNGKSSDAGKAVKYKKSVKIFDQRIRDTILKSQVSQLLETVNHEHSILTDEIIKWQNYLQSQVDEGPGEMREGPRSRRRRRGERIKIKEEGKEEAQVCRFKDAQGSGIIINATPGERRQEKEEEELLNGEDLSCKINFIDSSHATNCIIYLKKQLLKREEQILALRSLEANVQAATKYRDADT